jgi:SET domain-containing protein
MALIVKKSQLPNAGKGLFTTKPIKAGSKIIEYRGEIINWKQYMERVKRNEDGYLFYVNKNYCIDAFPTPQYKARYANDAAGLTQVKGLTNNSVYEVFGNKCFIVAERDIKAGEEIFVDYTQEYWDCIRYNIKHGHYKKKSDKAMAA